MFSLRTETTWSKSHLQTSTDSGQLVRTSKIISVLVCLCENLLWYWSNRSEHLAQQQQISRYLDVKTSRFLDRSAYSRAWFGIGGIGGREPHSSSSYRFCRRGRTVGRERRPRDPSTISLPPFLPVTTSKQTNRGTPLQLFP